MVQQPSMLPLAQRLFGPGGLAVAAFFDRVTRLADRGALAVPQIEPYSVRVQGYPADIVRHDTPSVAGALRTSNAAASAVLEATRGRWEPEGDAELWRYVQGIAPKVAAVLVVRGYADEVHDAEREQQYAALYDEWWPPHLRAI